MGDGDNKERPGAARDWRTNQTGGRGLLMLVNRI